MLVDAVAGVAIAHFSLDGHIKDEHYNFVGKRHNIFISEPESCPYISFFQQIIEAFSFEGQVVLSAMAGKGNYCTIMLYNSIVFPKFRDRMMHFSCIYYSLENQIHVP